MIRAVSCDFVDRILCDGRTTHEITRNRTKHELLFLLFATLPSPTGAGGCGSDSLHPPAAASCDSRPPASRALRVAKSQSTTRTGIGISYTSTLVDIRSVKDILHLKSGLAYLGDNRLAVIELLAKREEFGGYELVRLNAGEEYAANCVQVNKRVLVAAGYSQFERTLGDLGYETIAVDVSEFKKMDGGLSCLSLRF